MTKYFIIIFFALLAFIDIKPCNHVILKQKIEAIEVRDIDPVVGETYYRVFYLDKMIMYQWYYRSDSSVNQLSFNSTTDQITSDVPMQASQWKDQFFIFHEDSSHGYNYDTYYSSENKLRLKIDSVLKFLKGTNRWDSFLLIKPDTVIWNSDKSELKEVYIFPVQKDMPAGSLSMYYSNKMTHLKESFNTKVDSIRNMKLFKLETIFKEFYSEKDKRLWPQSKIVTEMREIKVEDPQQILNYFNKYKEKT